MKRQLKGMTLVHYLFLLLVLIYLGYNCFHNAKKFPEQLILLSLAFLILFFIHINRKDKRFLSHITQQKNIIYFSEYLVFSSPLWIILIASGVWYLSMLWAMLLFFLSLISYTPARLKSTAPLNRFIPDNNFEWKAGFRKYQIWIVVLYAASLALLYYPYASLFVLWFLFMIISEFYNHGESFEILRANEIPVKKFLLQKIKNHCKLYLLFISPVIILSTLIHPETWWVVCFFVLFTFIIMCYFIVSKYSLYEAGKSVTGNEIMKALVLISIALPFFLPVPLLLTIRNFIKAGKNLNVYLNAYNK